MSRLTRPALSALYSESRDRRVSLMLDFSADEIEAVRLSLRVAFWAMLGSLPFGLATAMVLARGRFWGKSLLDGVVHLPLVMPPVVTGYLLLLLFGRHGPLGRFLDESSASSSRFAGPARRSPRGDGVSADGARDPAVARRGRPPARGGRGHARRRERSLSSCS